MTILFFVFIFFFFFNDTATTEIYTLSLHDALPISLRAIALEGLPGYYRIRVATDVRLIYRRGEGNTLEILSLIDREDLDRYIRQARTRRWRSTRRRCSRSSLPRRRRWSSTCAT